MTKPKKVFGWKKCWAVDEKGSTVHNKHGAPVIILVKLEILGRVCVPIKYQGDLQPDCHKKRTDQAKVLEIRGLKKGQRAVSMKVKRDGMSGNERDGLFVYTKGAIVAPVYSFDDNDRNDCGSGINYFSTKKEAERYVFPP